MRLSVILAIGGVLFAGVRAGVAEEPIQVGFLWHMHQPIYYPYESVIETDANGRFSFSVVDVHNQRFGPYTTWPYDAISAGVGLPHLGAQVSFSGSLIENLNALEVAGVNGGMWDDWAWGYNQAINMTTSLGHPRLDLVAFGYHHPLMPLLHARDIRMQIRLHAHVYGQTWSGGAAYSRGMFPAETAFATHIIPALVAEEIDWVLVDNIHFDRACLGYPHTNESGMFAPNPADQVNPNPAEMGGVWVQLSDLWAPSQVSVPFGYQPHYVQYIDPETGGVTRMIAVPAARYEGNEDARGGFGAFLYEQVMDQYLAYNTDAAHPMFVVLHHDGDNHGGGSEAYYHANFQNMVDWASGHPDYDVTTVEDYLERFPPEVDDVIHVEPGSWAGADAGDPEFKKWLADPDAGGWSPDRNSWAVLVAAKNRVFTADDVAPATSMQNILVGSGSLTEQAWHWLLCGEASDYWYWDGTEIWDSNVTRACNGAVALADVVIAGEADVTPPTVFLPQREPYNPGGYEWGSTPEASDFEVWTFAYDVSGLANVALYWRVDHDGFNPLASVQNEMFAGGDEVGAWQVEEMEASELPPPQNGVLPATYRAERYGAMIEGQVDVLLDYYVEAVDGVGNVSRSPIQHVYVGTGAGGGGDAVEIDPDPAEAGEPVTVSYDSTGRVLDGAAQVYLHYGFDNWNPVMAPDPAMDWDGDEGLWRVTVPVLESAWQLDFVFHDGAGNWDNNDGADWHYEVVGGGSSDAWVMDGVLDEGATFVAGHGAMSLYAGVIDGALYVAAADAGEGSDHFIFVADEPGGWWSAPWAKSGQVAAWDAYLATEDDNGWVGWFEVSGAVQAATGDGSGWMEGTLDLAGEFGSVPNVVYLAFAPYETADGGALVWSGQVPASVNQDGNVDAGEYVAFEVGGLRPGDMNCDGVVDFDDIGFFVEALAYVPNGEGWPYADCPWLHADCNEDGTVTFDDIAPFVGLLGS